MSTLPKSPLNLVCELLGLFSISDLLNKNFTITERATSFLSAEAPHCNSLFQLRVLHEQHLIAIRKLFPLFQLKEASTCRYK